MVCRVCNGSGMLWAARFSDVCPMCEGVPGWPEHAELSLPSAPSPSMAACSSEPRPSAGRCGEERQMDILHEFVRKGFVKLSLPEDEVPAHVHQTIYDKAKRARDISNNIFPDIIDLEKVLTAKTLVNALETVLGPRCRLHRHRYLHKSLSVDQAFHKDSSYGFRRPRNHRLRGAMVLYYPQKTTIDMGPTAVLSGSQYLALDHEADPTVGEDTHPKYGMMVVNNSVEKLQQIAVSIDASLKGAERFIEVEAGSVCLMHYDLWHRASKRKSPISKSAPERYMIKLQYYRVNEPCTIQGSEPSLQPTIRSICPGDRMRVLQEEMMMWHGAKPHSSDPALAVDDLQPLILEIHSESEAARISAAYSLGRVARTANAELQQEALACLAEAMNEISERLRRAAAFGLVAAGPVAGPALLVALHSAAASGRSRKYVLWALGEIDTVSSEASRALLDASAGTDGYVYDDACGERLAKAAATAALGLMAQRAHRAGDEELFSKICQQLIVSATPRDHLPPEDLVREEASLSLLLACEAGPALAAAQPGLVLFLQRLASHAAEEGESDRYVIGYASEALLSLAEADCVEAQGALEAVLNVDREGNADFQRLVRQRRCPHSTGHEPYMSLETFHALEAEWHGLAESSW